VQSKLHLTAELGRDKFALKSLDFSTTPRWWGDDAFVGDALVQHFASPQWQASVTGNVGRKAAGLSGRCAGAEGERLSWQVHGHSCSVTPQVAQKNPHFWQRHKKPLPPSAKVLPPDPNCAAGYLLVGSMKAHNVVYRNENVRLPNINGGADCTLRRRSYCLRR
jgi:translocation and assembly module TamB